MNSDVRPIRIGVDIGGTFTDLQILNAGSRVITNIKTPTTPDDPSIGLMTGIKQAAARDLFALSDIGYLLHGTTIATNAVLERKLAKGALVTTAGFEDVMEIGRHYRREIYSLNPQAPPTLIPRNRRVGIKERIKADGTIEVRLTTIALEELAHKLDELDVSTVAICLLNAYINPKHEYRIAEYLANARPALKVSCSSVLNAEIREYERTSTTVLNALLIPVIAGYLDKLKARLRGEGCSPRLLLVQSNGGVCSAETAAQQPARLLLSGPSGGSAACALIAQFLSKANIVGIDMGGTSFDVSVVREGKVSLITQGEIDKMPVRLPMVEIRTIGAGGGSLAKVRPGGRLTVGPESAGARPGPACYAQGGQEPTVTDANIALGRLHAKHFLGGTMQLDASAAHAAIDAYVAKSLGLSMEVAAEGILSVTNANMGAAIRLSLFEKGLDPRDFAIIAFGGAAGLQALAVADELGISEVVFPESAATLSAFGILHSNLVHDLARSKVLDAKCESLGALTAMADALLAGAKAQLDRDGVSVADRQLELAADMRYKGQAFELTVPARSTRFDAIMLDGLIADFHESHRRRFSYSNPEARVEIVSLRMSGIGFLSRPNIKRTTVSAKLKPPSRRKLYISGSWREIAVWRRDQIGHQTVVEGPAVIEEPYTTILISEGWSCRRAVGGHLIATRVER
jgi:N-methylhydantoinase A/oxoprolinase/acetone carboxylase beta subunit